MGEELKVWRCGECGRLFPMDTKARSIIVAESEDHIEVRQVCEECYARITAPPARGNLTEGD